MAETFRPRVIDVLDDWSDCDYRLGLAIPRRDALRRVSHGIRQVREREAMKDFELKDQLRGDPDNSLPILVRSPDGTQLYRVGRCIEIRVQEQDETYSIFVLLDTVPEATFNLEKLTLGLIPKPKVVVKMASIKPKVKMRHSKAYRATLAR
jgi:hypothetical protein